MPRVTDRQTGNTGETCVNPCTIDLAAGPRDDATTARAQQPGTPKEATGMQDQNTRAAALSAITRDSMTALPFTLAALPAPATRPQRQPGRLARFARSAARHPITTGRTCVHAAKMLPTVRKALPWYVLPIVVLAALVKMMPLDFGIDETLFAVAFALVLWRRPGLLEALYREAASGKPARCQCERHTRKENGR